MGSMKVWDGTAWQTASAGPSLPPVTSVDGRAGAVSLTDLYMSATTGWTPYTPLLLSAGVPSGAGMTPGTGGYTWGAWKMIAPYHMAIRVRFYWGSTGGSGGAGQIGFGLPAGYTTPADYYQHVVGWLASSGGTMYTALGEAPPNGYMVYMRAIEATTSIMRPVDVTINFPAGWYPSGGCGFQGVLNVAQRL